ncbi:MAG: carbohydrate ABC transporter permease [Firmicutes bacterium]|nr:carbohydrate ABC transporter permease [Bacillota bacterium]
MSRLRFSEVMRHIVLWMACIITLIPFIWILLNSLKYFRDIVNFTWTFRPTLINYYRLFFDRGSDFPALFGNSLIVAILATLACVSIGSLGAYSLDRFRWGQLTRSGVLNWILFFQIIPPVTMVGPFYVIVSELGLYNTRWGLVLVYLILNMPFAIWMMRSFFNEVPRELEESAYIDGCTKAACFRRVVLPLTAPGLAATAVLTFVFNWNEFLFALSLTSTANAMTVPVGIANFVQEYGVKYGEMSAAAFLATLPALFFVAFVQKYLVKGLTLGAVKQ